MMSHPLMAAAPLDDGICCQNLHLGHFEAKWILELCHVPHQVLLCYDTNAGEQLSSQCAGTIDALSPRI